MSKIGIFTIIKNEHRFLDEWLQYHIKLGIDKLYVFEDVDSLSHEEICNKYNNVELFKITDIYDEGQASKIINDKHNKRCRYGLQRKFMYDIIEFIYRQNCLDWLIYIDADEFVTLEDESKDIHNIINEYKDYAVLVLRWKNYSADGHVYRPDGGVIENYKTPCSNTAYLDTIKIANKLAFNLHKWNKDTVKCNFHIPLEKSSDKFKWCKTDYTSGDTSVSYKNIYIRHYITKSFEDYCNKLFVRGQFSKSMTISRFFNLNYDISRDNKDVVKILNDVYNKFMNGELDFSIW
jgi:hypothetical protein